VRWWRQVAYAAVPQQDGVALVAPDLLVQVWARLGAAQPDRLVRFALAHASATLTTFAGFASLQTMAVARLLRLAGRRVLRSAQ
jgi:hypothetical protein